MSLKALQDYTFVSRYARYLQDYNRRETWHESVDRMKQMHIHRYPHITDDINWAFDFAFKKKAIGSQRALQFAGEPILRNHGRMYNCISSYCDRLRFFQEALWLLLCGCGTGFSVQKHHISKLPNFQKSILDGNNRTKKKFVIPDSIEGWADALGVLLSSYFENPTFPEYYGCDVELVYSNIREKGSDLSHGFGKAPGPEPLKQSLSNIRKLLNSCIQNGQTRLKPINAYDITMHASDAVLSGGIRRSASICIFSPDDEEMLNAKTGNWFLDNPQRARSNNSALLIRDSTTKDFFDFIIDKTKQFGEPGFYWASDTEALPNPCQPANAEILTPNGIRTFEEISEGDYIWSETGWTKVVKKWSTGVKSVYKYETSAGSFYGTKNHRVISNKEKIEVKDAPSIDILTGPYNTRYTIDPQDVIDGLVIGDGCYFADDSKPNTLNIGKNDYSYFDSEIKDFIEYIYDGDYCYKINSTITKSELGYTYNRFIPYRFYRDPKKAIGFLRGLYSANGSICGHRVSLKTSSARLREQVQSLLSSLGIKSHYTTNKSTQVEFSNGQYLCKESYDINITQDREKFKYLIGFIQPYKNNNLDISINSISGKSNSKSTFDIRNIEYIGEEEVFDITVDNKLHTYWTQGCNVSNCVEIGFYCYDEDGNSGWQACNLSSINGKKVYSEEDFIQSAKAASIIGTLQAGYTDLEYLGQVSKNIIEREALLGVSITGIMDSPDILLDPKSQRKAAKEVVKTNQDIAKKININPASRTTCVKPEGCRPSNAMVTTDKGLLTLGELMEDHDIRNTWDGVTKDINTDGGNINRSFINGKSKTHTIKMNYGVEVESTPNHPWFVKYRIDRNKHNNKIEINDWVETKDIQFGDVLDVSLNAYKNNIHAPLEKEYRLKAFDKHNYNANNIVQPDYVDENLAWLIGYIWGDGCMKLNKYKLSFIDNHLYNLEKVKDICYEYFGIKAVIHPCNDRNAYTLEFANKFLWYWLIRNDIYKYDGQYISNIPRVIRSSSKSDILSFIAGIIDSDGHVRFEHTKNCKRYQACVSTANYEFANQLQQVALACGICFSKSENTQGGNKQHTKRIWLLNLSCHADPESFEHIKNNSEKISRLPSGFQWKFQVNSTNSNILGKVVSNNENEQAIMTYDVETKNHWFYAGAIASHNTSSCVLGSSSGIHPHHAKRYFRRIQANELEPPLQFFAQQNPMAVEKSVWSANDTDMVITFPIEVPDGSKTKTDIDASTLLENVKLTQNNWVRSGIVKENLTKPWLEHNVSNTVNVKPDEWEKVTDFIYNNRYDFAGISLLSVFGDKDYPQAPMCTVYTPREIVSYYGDASMFASGLIELALQSFGGNLWQACDVANGLGNSNLNKDQQHCIEKINKFAHKYFSGDVQKVTYLLKDVYNWKLWIDLKREYKDVDYTEMVEREDNTKAQETIACGSGKCEII